MKMAMCRKHASKVPQRVGWAWSRPGGCAIRKFSFPSISKPERRGAHTPDSYGQTPHRSCYALARCIYRTEKYILSEKRRLLCQEIKLKCFPAHLLCPFQGI